MKDLITPINADNFEANWAIVDSERRIAKKKYHTTGFASFFSNMVLVVLTFFATNGLIHDHMRGSYCDFLEDVPYLLPIWHKCSSYFLKTGQSWQVQTTLTALVILGVSFLVCGLFVLLVTAVYHPFKQPLPTDTSMENAQKLLAAARDARRFANRTGNSGNLSWTLILVIAQFLLLAMYILLGLPSMDVLLEIITEPLMDLLKPYMQNDTMYYNAQNALFMPSLMLSAFALYLFSTLVSSIHAKTVNFMYRYKVPYSFVAEVEYYNVFSEEDVGTLSAEEIQLKRTESAQEWLAKGLEMESICAYTKAKEYYAQAAHSGSPEAMEHYARFWLIANAKDPARYWLERCVATGNASETATKNLRRMKWRRKVRAAYIK